MLDNEYSVIKRDVIKSFDCTKQHSSNLPLDSSVSRL